MEKDQCNDVIMREIPVFLSKSLLNQLHVFQYQEKSLFQSVDEGNILKAQVKPESKQVELEVEIKTTSKTYDRSRGEQIASSVDGSLRDSSLNISDEKYYSSHTMDKLLLTSSKVLSDVNRYGMAIMGENSLHISPVSSMLYFRSSFNYMDKASQRSKRDQKDEMDCQLHDSEEDDSIKKVNVRFERPETERSKSLKEKSYRYLQKKKSDEPWIPVIYNKFKSEKSEFDSRLLYCANNEEGTAPFALENAPFLHSLVPLSQQPLAKDLKTTSLSDKLKSLMLSTVVASFCEILDSVCCGRQEKEYTNVLEQINKIAVLVQGNWVVKSDQLYPKTAKLDTPNDIIQKARDCMLYKFTKNKNVSSSSIRELSSIPDQNLAKLFKEVSICKEVRGTWTFKLPTDTTFLKKHPDVAQRQQMIWEVRYEQLSHSFKK